MPLFDIVFNINVITSATQIENHKYAQIIYHYYAWSLEMTIV